MEEHGCAVCGLLYPVRELLSIKHNKLNTDILCITSATRKERKSIDDPIEEVSGPVLTGNKDSICRKCAASLKKEQMPSKALANGLWLGEIPSELQNLTWMEQRLIAKIIYNYCIVRVFTGAHKMRANAISHAIPMPKIYSICRRCSCSERSKILFKRRST